ncbi:MAG: MarR family transcriptional regulator [Eubacteriaceae bacterium]|jgi:DNA-binding MarR family transcriptional regulator|nr:MarR family transcriptional regulator [Eubacteriaceae bacterium]
MDEFSVALNDILVEAYYNILDFEEQAIKKDHRLKLSINEMHLIEAVGKKNGKGRTIGEIAEDLRITMPSATIAVNKITAKGYTEKMRCQEDGRVVRVRLTKEGQKIERYHRFYHHRMVEELSKNLTDEERQCLVRAIKKLNTFFQNSLREGEKE